MRGRDLLSIREISPDELDLLLNTALSMKRDGSPPLLQGKTAALVFEKPSLRTRSTFMIAVRELGGDVIEPPADVVLGGRETIADVARNLERWMHGVVIRTFAQARREVVPRRTGRPRVLLAPADRRQPRGVQVAVCRRHRFPTAVVGATRVASRSA